MKAKLLLITVFVVIALAVGGTVVAVTIFKEPAVVATNALGGLAKDVLERDEIKPFCELFTSGSIEASLDGMKVNGYDSFGEGSISGKLYFSEDALMLRNVNVNLADGALDLSGDAYISEDVIYVNEQEILGGTYGINFSTLADDLANSIFAPYSGSEYALDEKTYDTIIKRLDNVSENKMMQSDLEKLSRRVFLDLWEIVLDHAELSSEVVKIDLNGKNTKVRLISITIDSLAMQNIIRDAYEYLCDSEEIVAFIEKHENALCGVLEALYPYDWDAYGSLAELYKEKMRELSDTVEDLCNELEPDFSALSINIATSRISGKLLKLWIGDDRETVLSIDCGKKGIRKTDTVTIEAGEVKILYKVDKKGIKKLGASIAIESHNQEIEFSISIDKKEGTYTATFEHVKNEKNYYVTEWAASGNIATKGSTITFTIDKVNYKYRINDSSDWRKRYELECEVIVKLEDEMPMPRKVYKTVADITEADIENFVKKLEELVS